MNGAPGIGPRRDRLKAVLQAAIGAPGNGPRLRAAGLVEMGHLGTPQLVTDWVERFSQMPILTKAAVRQQPGQFLASMADVAYRGSTSGSRGQAYEFFAGQSWNQQRVRARDRALAWWGITADVPILNLASRLMPGRQGDSAIAGPVSADTLERAIGSLGRTPTALRGYPSRLCEVAAVIPPDFPPVRAILCTGEPLFDHQKQFLERAFQAPVVNEYGCHEAAAFGLTCPEGGRLHLDEDRCAYDVIAQQLITTDLWNETMPLIRYQSGDLVKAHKSPCPCGRPGLTVDLLGRLEDRVTTVRGLVPTGQVAMPPLAGIGHYRIRRGASGQVSAWAMGDPAQRSRAQAALTAWVRETFGAEGGGDGAIAIAWATPPAVISPVPWSDDQWQRTITGQSLGAWLGAGAMPVGEARATADLLKALVSPTVIGQPLAPAVQAQIARLAAAPPATELETEILRSRVLLLATSVLPEGEAVALYRQTLDRLRPLPAPPTAAPRLDCLIPSLHLPSAVTEGAWIDPRDRGGPDHPWPLDPLNAHHLLAAFDGVLHRHGPRQRPPAAQALAPLLAVLVGDLRHWAAEFTLGHLIHWVTLVQGQAPPWSATVEPDPGKEIGPFAAAWLVWRRHLVQKSPSLAAAWEALAAAATEPTQDARLWVEWGYGQRVQGQALGPDLWLPRLKAHGVDLWDPSPPSPAVVTPWLPIVRALAEPLHRRGQGELAYRCLTIASPATQQQTAFASLSQEFNQKQAVLMDLAPWGEDWR